MNPPLFVFKPVIVDRPVRFGGPDDEAYNESYKGMWVDGGMLNNLPLHSYDHLKTLPHLTYMGKRRTKWGGYEVAVPPGDEPRPFNDWTLGVRLGLRDTKPFKINEHYGEKSAGVLFDFAGQLLTAFLADSSDSQIRSPLEHQRVCTLDVSELDLLDFAGPAIDEARGQRTRADRKRRTLITAERTMREFLGA